jgi:hypothetical protein
VNCRVESVITISSASVEVPAGAETRESLRISFEKYPNKIGLRFCGRFCSCQSTEKPQESTRTSREALIHSITSTYFLQISTRFHKWFDLFWEQRVGGSNPSAPTILIYNRCHCESSLTRIHFKSNERSGFVLIFCTRPTIRGSRKIPQLDGTLACAILEGGDRRGLG